MRPSSHFLLWVAALTVQPPIYAETTVVLHLGDHQFKPATISVNAGEALTVTLINDDRFTPHTFTLDAGGMSADVEVGRNETKSTTLHPAVPGTYPFYCTKKMPFMASHRDKGMEGQLVVEPSAEAQAKTPAPEDGTASNPAPGAANP